MTDFKAPKLPCYLQLQEAHMHLVDKEHELKKSRLENALLTAQNIELRKRAEIGLEVAKILEERAAKAYYNDIVLFRELDGIIKHLEKCGLYQ